MYGLVPCGCFWNSSVAKKIKRQKCTKKKVSGFTRDAVAAMLAVPDVSTKTGTRDLVFLTLLYATAGRLDEIRSIKIRHLHLDGKKSYVNLIGKRDKIRTAYLLPKVVSYIKVYLDAFHENPPDSEAYLFYSRVGGKRTKLSEPALAKRIKICAEAAHAKISFLLGHEQLETTMRYLDITTEDKIKALATLEDECQKTVPKKWKNKSSTLTDFCGLKT